MSSSTRLLFGLSLSGVLHGAVVLVCLSHTAVPQAVTLGEQSIQLTLAMFQPPAVVTAVAQPKTVTKKTRPKSRPKPQVATQKATSSVATEKIVAVEPETEVLLEPDSILADVEQEAVVASQAREPLLNTQPVYFSQLAPRYPRKALSRGQQGTVLLMLLVGAEGKVVGVDVVQSSGVLSLDKAAIKAVQRWRLQPAEDDGVAVLSRVKVPIKFDLRSS